ncbi:hypothetical protein I3J27_21535 [Bradyrhizobium xenonodulans]|uniref:Uncharacterized protein n=1 Tax=Bradyrhizobium xenonodulans TaxID=2736875 RepID=A0ABY7MDL2_9BRAD|nr:hypothetical protein [Bradyrhizobium xenonodulans]WBL75618.1 hypothetical protein I3J27_21535 [Bradyrhizobium xenonodulans]
MIDASATTRLDIRCAMPDTSSAALTAHSLYDFVKDFQPMFAAAVALTAAAIAYRGVMAKVNFDRSIDSRTQRSIDLALFLRLRTQLESAASLALILRQNLNSPSMRQMKVDWDKTLYWECDVSELDEAWKHLDRIPTPCIIAVARARNADKILRSCDAEGRQAGHATPDLNGRYWTAAHEFATNAKQVLEVIKPEIERLQNS